MRSGAAALYQQYLKKADPKSETAGQAVIAVHALLRDQLNDAGAAYSFNRSDGDRLAVNPTARQFDQWFLDEAMQRKDAVAVANRLHALIKAGIPDDLRVTLLRQLFPLAARTRRTATSSNRARWSRPMSWWRPQAIVPRR